MIFSVSTWGSVCTLAFEPNRINERSRAQEVPFVVSQLFGVSSRLRVLCVLRMFVFVAAMHYFHLTSGRWQFRNGAQASCDVEHGFSARQTQLQCGAFFSEFSRYEASQSNGMLLTETIDSCVATAVLFSSLSRAQQGLATPYLAKFARFFVFQTNFTPKKWKSHQSVR